ncbi:MAG TPA: TolC family outer membrane protein [Pseudolabrys sp.]|jgi:outer membrane protein|uniref:TolC family outer membrane protein n=1 Tax=Pseudolabrys sp. TaxID=1960880 RepID=UPI002DDCEEF5|nr:TolC family outer membrane protein [Pseudolabrys sp.]HEV2627273.1 TolC family outer membrane protein [Pseudolabrys sp.]
MLRFGAKNLLAVISAALLGAVSSLAMGAARADTLDGALALAYRNNPSLNAQRAGTRATDENVPQALAGYRPKVNITATGGEQSLSTTSKSASSSAPGTSVWSTSSGYNSPLSVGLTMTQTLFNGFQTANKTRQAEAQVLSARATLATTVQNVLLNAVTAYMNLLRDSAILDLQKRNVEVLQEQLRQTRDRFNVGEVTRTDVAQSESSLAAGRSQVLTAEANFEASQATYRQVIGINPGKLAPGTPVDRFSPKTLPGAVAVGIGTNPSVAAAQYNVDVALRQVKVAEGALLPNLSVQGSVQKSWLGVGVLSTMESYNASVLGTLTVPVYQGGAEYSLIRQAKETLGQQRLNLDVSRDTVRQNVVQAWGQLQAAKANIEATQAQVQAAEIALNGIREEARVGQRTTFDVLTAQQTLVNARVAVVTAQHDRVVASYTLLAAVGRLSPDVLGLHVPVYRPQVHYEQVRDAWAGTRNPDGR